MQRYARLGCILATGLCWLIGARAAVAAISDAHVERVDATHLVISWQDRAPVDVYVSPRADVDIRHAKPLSEKNRDSSFMTAVDGGVRPYFLLRDDRDGTTLRVAERVLPLERGSNFRDIGGYAAAGDKHVRWGLIYRSAATPMLSDADVSQIRALGLATMIDLRSREERELAPSRLAGPNVRIVAIDYPFKDVPQSYDAALIELAPQYRRIFKELLEHRAPLSYNCTAGQDRTGIASALVLAALGVPRETILQDYHLTTRYRRPEYEVPVITSEMLSNNPAAALFAEVRGSRPEPLYDEKGRSMLAELLDHIDAKWGSVDRYLETVLTIGPAQRAELRSIYLE